jgi:hypothetical protein
MVHPMTDPNDSPLVAPEQFFATVTFASRTDRGERIGGLFRSMNVARHVAGEHIRGEPRADVTPMTPQSMGHSLRRPENLAKSSVIAACLAIGLAALGGCNNPADCSGGQYGGGCAPGAGVQVAPNHGVVAPPAVNPAAVSPAAASPGVGRATPGPSNANRGDPGDFADVDDKQCRSYGLKFGTHDYADCRIRLSAQHRGLDPGLGAATPGSGSR